MVYLHLTTNVGSLGGQTTAANPNQVSEVRRNLYNVTNCIKDRYGSYPASIGLQETGNHEVDLGRGYGTPVATDAHCSNYSSSRCISRGVATYALANTAVEWPPLNDSAEVVTTLHKVPFNHGRGETTQKVAFINVYRLTHRDASNHSIENTVNYITDQLATLKRNNIKKMVIHGDFNQESVTIPGFRELRHPQMYHKLNASSGKRFIDKVFVNFDQASILDAYPTCENKDDRTADDLGHKAILIRVGARLKEKITKTFVPLKAFKAEVRKLDDSDTLRECVRNVDSQGLLDSVKIEGLAKYITDLTVGIKDRVEVVTKVNRITPKSKLSRNWRTRASCS